jgi:hypothetical protein
MSKNKQYATDAIKRIDSLRLQAFVMLMALEPDEVSDSVVDILDYAVGKMEAALADLTAIHKAKELNNELMD